MASRRRMVRGLALTVGAAVVLIGCGNSNNGTPTASSTTATSTTSPAKTSAKPDAALWDPCALRDDAISGTGLDPATKDKNVAGVQFPGWKVCSWRANARWYDLSIMSGTPTLQDIQKRTDYAEFTPQSVGSRRAIQFVDGTDPQRLGCYLAVELKQGSVMFKVFTRYSIGKQGDPCQEVRRHTEDLARDLPAS